MAGQIEIDLPILKTRETISRTFHSYEGAIRMDLIGKRLKKSSDKELIKVLIICNLANPTC